MSCIPFQKTIAQSALLWKISGNGIAQPSFLFGTMHISCPEDIVLDSALLQSLRASKKVVFEMDLDNPSLLLQLQQSMVLRDTAGWQSFLSPAAWQQISDSLQRNLGLPKTFINKMQPFAIMSLALQKLMPCPQTSGWEMKLMQVAKKEQKEIEGLESLQRQVQVMQQLSKDTLAYQLLNLYTKRDSTLNGFTLMMELYRKKDIDRLAQMIQDSGGTAVEAALLTTRNKEWIPLISQMSKASPCFFAVGAGHLGGKEGVIALLQAEGFTVSPME